MTFFNKKTDVIDIELTPYGRYLLSIGKLKPKYYDFSDDDVLYDIAADGVSSENNEDAHNRIVTNTPKLKTLYLTKGVESDAQENYGSTQATANTQIDQVRTMTQEVSHNQRALMPLGRSSYSSQRFPNFQVTMLQGQITGSVPYLSLEDPSASKKIVDFLPVPQIDVDFVVTATITSELLDPSENHQFVTELYDGKYVKLTFESPIIHLKEFGSFYEKENFDIEVYEISSYEYKSLVAGPGTEPYVGQSLRPKKFAIAPNAIVNDILVAESLPQFHPAETISTERVEYYFDIEVDKEISQEELCSVVQNLEVTNQFLDEELICPDQRTERFNIYSSRVNPDDLEDCD